METTSILKIEPYQRWKEKEGQDIIEIRYAYGEEITYVDVNGNDYGVEAKMKQADFRKKYEPTYETLSSYKSNHPEFKEQQTSSGWF